MWRSATTADDDRITEMCLALYAEDPGTRPVDARRIRRTLQRFRDDPGRGRCLVLDVEGNARGYALLVSYWSNELGGNVTHVDEMYVGPAARGRGHGGELLRRLAGGELGWPETVALQLEVTPANARARALYARCGFTPVRNANLRRLLSSPA